MTQPCMCEGIRITGNSDIYIAQCLMKNIAKDNHCQQLKTYCNSFFNEESVSNHMSLSIKSASHYIHLVCFMPPGKRL